MPLKFRDEGEPYEPSVDFGELFFFETLKDLEHRELGKKLSRFARDYDREMHERKVPMCSRESVLSYLASAWDELKAWSYRNDYSNPRGAEASSET